MRQSAPSLPKSAERIEGLTIAIFYLYAPLFYKFLFPFVPLCWRFQTAKTAWAWLSFSLHENEQKIKPANGFFTEMTYLERSVHLRRNSLSQSLTALPAPSEREPLARPEDLHFNRKLYRHAKGPIPEGAGIERSEMTGGVSSAAKFPHTKTARPPRSMGQSGWKFILRASCWRGLPQRVLRRPHPAGASCRRGSAPRWAG